MRSVSSDLSSERISQALSAKAASSKVRLLMLFEPGRATVLCALSWRGASVRDSVMMGFGEQWERRIIVEYS